MTIEIHQIPHVIFETRFSFSSNIASLFSVMRYLTSVLFRLKLYMFWTKGAHQNANFQTFDCLNSLCHFFKPRVSSPLNFKSTFSVVTHNSYETFWLKHCMFWTNRVHLRLSKDFSDLWMFYKKVHLIPHAVFETLRSKFIQILYHCLVSWKITHLYFRISNLAYLEQKAPIKNKFSNFWVVEWKFTKFLMSHLEHQVSFSLDF